MRKAGLPCRKFSPAVPWKGPKTRLVVLREADTVRTGVTVSQLGMFYSRSDPDPTAHRLGPGEPPATMIAKRLAAGVACATPVFALAVSRRAASIRRELVVKVA